MNALISELKSEALKERHWERLTRELRVSWNQNDLTLGQVWEIDLIRHESVIRQMLLVAQGELALELFLKQVKDYWQSYTVDLVNYQNKTMLIRGWDDLFNKLKEHINSLAAMKLSPYYKVRFSKRIEQNDETFVNLFNIFVQKYNVPEKALATVCFLGV